MKDKNKPPKFIPTKDDVNQMEETYQHFMEIAKRNGITEKTTSDIIIGLVRRLFKERHAKNWYKTRLIELNGKD